MSYPKNSLRSHIRGAILIPLLFLLILSLIITLLIGYRKQENRIDAYYPEHTRAFYINDYSHVLTFETEKYIIDEASRLEKITSSKLVTVMIPETSNNLIEIYSRRLAEEWGIAQNDDNNALILFTTTTPNSWVNLGKGIVNGVKKEYFQKTKNILTNTAKKDQNDRCWNRAARNTFTTIAIMLYNKAGERVPNTLTMLDQNIPCPDFANADSTANETSVTFADGDYENPTSDADNSMFDFESTSQFFGVWLVVTLFICMGFGLNSQHIYGPSDCSLDFDCLGYLKKLIGIFKKLINYTFNKFINVNNNNNNNAKDKPKKTKKGKKSKKPKKQKE